MRSLRPLLAGLCMASLAAGDVAASPRRAGSGTPARSAAPVSKSSSRAAPTRNEKEARAHFQRAEKSFSVGRFREALASYEAAYKALPLPAFVFNIAQCHRNLGQPERAVFFYRRYLAVDPNPPNRALVEELIAEEQIRWEDEQARQQAAARKTAPPPLSALLAPTPAPAPASPSPRIAEADTREDARIEETSEPNLFQKWWFWTAVGAVVVGGGAALFIERQGPMPAGTLGSVDLRPGQK
jgi:tetratricopeptide (TPR) repeat protein